MRFTALSTLFLVGAVASKTLEDIYGPVEEVHTMHAKSVPLRAADTTDDYRKHRRAEECDFAMDILLVQDKTSSFNDNWQQMATVQLDLMFEALKKTHPGSRYGMLDFKDKPIPPFGIPPTVENGHYTDYCVHLDADFSTNVTIIRDIYAAGKPSGGGDPSESQFTALMAAVQSDYFTWEPEHTSTRLVVMVTDAPPHFEGEVEDTKGMVPFSGKWSADEAQCTKEFYPGPQQVREALDDKYAYLATLVYDPHYWNGLPAKSWDWFNTYMGQTKDFINLSAADFNDFWANLGKVIQYIEDLECNTPPTTVAPVPSTVVPTTTPAPTTVTTLGAPGSVTPAGTPQPPPVDTTEHECPPCPDEECPPCGTPPPRPEECDETVYCDEGVYMNIGFKPDSLKLNIDGKDVEI